MDLAISAAGRRIVDAVIEAPVAWRSPGELAARLGWDLDRTLDEIADLDAAGWLEAWELVDGPVVTLSVGATATCGVRLVEVGRDETLRWARPGDPDPPRPAASGVFRTARAAGLDLVADDRPGVEAAAILAEEVEARAVAAGDARRAAAFDRLPKPTLLIGGGLSPWPGPREVGGEDCPACRSARLPTRAYCLWCDRWGFDFLVDASPSPQVRTRMPNPKAEARRRETERRKRRAKRKERRLVQSRSSRPKYGRNDRDYNGPMVG